MESIIEHRRIATNGIELHCALAGPQDGPLVVMLHGFPEYWRGWRGQVDALVAAGYRVCLPDQRGYNLSDKPRGVSAYRIDILAADIVGLIDVLGYERARVVAHDWGAAVAWLLGAAHAERLDKLAILNVPHPLVMDRFLKRNFHQLRKSWYIFYFQLPFLPEFGLKGRRPMLARSLLDVTPPGTFPEDELEQMIEAWQQPGAATGMINWYRAALRRPYRWPNGGRVTATTLVIWGTHDFALSGDMAAPSVEMCDDGRLETIEDGGHFVQHSSPERVNELLLDFLA